MISFVNFAVTKAISCTFMKEKQLEQCYYSKSACTMSISGYLFLGQDKNDNFLSNPVTPNVLPGLRPPLR